MADEQGKLRVFVDANILVAGNVWPRWPYEVLQHALRGDFRLVLNPYVIEEARPTLARRFAADMPRFETFLELCPCEVAGMPTGEAITDMPILFATLATCRLPWQPSRPGSIALSVRTRT